MRLMELKGQTRVIVVYGGGFQPFHMGHMSSYSQAKEQFPDADFYVAASNDTKTRPIPFDAKKFLAQQAGVADDFVQVRQPINPQEIMQKYDATRDILVLVRSERDPMSYTKKDGSPGYYQPFVSVDNCEPFDQHGYIFVTKKHTFKVNGQEIYSGSQVREMYAAADEGEQESIIAQLYPDSNQLDKIKQIFDQYLSQQGVAEGSLNEFASDSDNSREPDEEEILRQLAALWWLGTEQQMATAQKTLASMGWEIGQDESGDDDAGVFVIRAGDVNGNSYIAFNHSDLELNESQGDSLKSNALSALITVKQQIQQDRMAELEKWEQDFKNNVVSKFKSRWPNVKQPSTSTPVAQPGEKHSELKAKLSQLNMAIEKQAMLDKLVQKLDSKGLLSPTIQAGVDTSLLVRDGARDNYVSLNQKLDKALDFVNTRLMTHKAAYAKPKSASMSENMDHSKDDQAVPELKSAMLDKKEKLQDATDDEVYDIIDTMMTRIAKSHGISGQKLHDMWVDKYEEIPDTWIMDENFADGRHPERKGLAKRSGVDTKASVTDLRKTAKNSSGEKARMAHWLANMKAGRAKKSK